VSARSWRARPLEHVLLNGAYGIKLTFSVRGLHHAGGQALGFWNRERVPVNRGGPSAHLRRHSSQTQGKFHTSS
jgi:hypothetical protein